LADVRVVQVPLLLCRFNTAQVPSAEWAVFGSFLFLLPQIELLEVEGTLLLSVNCAWDNRLETCCIAEPAQLS